MLRIYDSFRRAKIPFTPIRPGHVSIYVCGPTTYAAAHIGHAYSAICFDTICRALRWLGFEVTHVRNVTDIDDKIIARANETGEAWDGLAARYAGEYSRDMARFGVGAPDIEPRATDHIAGIVALIEKLVAAGKAYESGGDVWFSVESFADYGKLSGQSLGELRAGARVEVDDRKRSPVDFALWKAAKPGEPSWESPWGRGRPGWHIECSAMCLAHLGETFDLHGGGKDLIFPHHENEIAQSQGALGPDTFARYWLHNGFLNFAGEKMSKSLGNVLGCEAIAEAHGGEAMRFFTVSHHYRSPANFEIAGDGAGGGLALVDLEAAERRLDYFYATLQRLDAFAATAADPGDGEVTEAAAALAPAVRAALEDDFNTPVAIAALGEAARAANKLLDEPKSAPKAVRKRSLVRLRDGLRDGGSALGLLQGDPAEFLASRRRRLAKKRGIDTVAVEKLVGERTVARQERDFGRADELREELAGLGVEVLDPPAGPDWRITE
ncbi:MAG TPA: cysteine--tRNA ligase [Kofleriaceae bacterium]|nr:cysteine--tRNA ligase [Kofleriaceae bacterium]